MCIYLCNVALLRVLYRTHPHPHTHTHTPCVVANKEKSNSAPSPIRHLNGWKNNLKFVHYSVQQPSQLLIYVDSNIRIIIKAATPYNRYL